MLNRCGVIVRPKRPYIEWARGLDDSGLIPDYGGEKTIYLLPECFDAVKEMEVLSKGYDIVFEAELEGWCTDESTWPKNRTFKMFRDWFEVEIHSMVMDLCGYPIEDDENT